MKKGWLLVALTLLLAGCGGGMHVREMEASDSSLIYGAIDMGGSNTILDFVSLARMTPGQEDEYSGARIAASNDAFYLENMETGSYRLSHFGSRLGAATYEYVLPESGKHMYDFRVGKQQLTFIGSYRFKKIKKGFNEYTFELTPTKSPSEKQILQKILPNTQGTKWEAVVRKRLRELK